MINSIYSKHFQSIPTDYFSDFLIWNAFLKLSIVLLAWACFETCKDWIFEAISMKLLDVNVYLNNISLKNGKYSCVKYKRLSHKWKIYDDHYVYLAGNVIVERNLKKKTHKIYYISDNHLLSDQGESKTIKYVSNNILKIEDEFFVLDNSATQSEISDSKRQVGLNILQINHYSIWNLLASYIIIFLILTQLITFSMKNSHRGVYFYCASCDVNKPDFDRFDKNDKIVFSKDDIYIIKRSDSRSNPDIIFKYRYDDVTMTIKNKKGERIGEIETIPNSTVDKKSIIIHEDNIRKIYYPKLSS